MSLDISLTAPIVSVAWLHEHINAEHLIVLDGTINKVFDGALEQIPNARLFDIKKKFSDVSNAFPSAFPSAKQFEREAQNLGINHNSALVVYDDKGIYSSARVWWMFKAFGFNNVAVLNGGFPAWKLAGHATEPMRNFDEAAGNFKAMLQPNYMQFFDDIKAASANKTHTIIDARSKGRFNFETPEPRAGLRMGTIPNSVNLPFTDLLDDGVLKSKKELARAFYMVAEPDEQIIFSCGSGLTACVLALAAEISGYKNIAVYDGSWTEYGSLTSGIMEHPKTWSKPELLAYILLYVAHSDLEESNKEKQYILNRVDKDIYARVHKRLEKDHDYQSIQNIIAGIETHDYYRNELADLFADIKLMAFADGVYNAVEAIIYNRLKDILY